MAKSGVTTKKSLTKFIVITFIGVACIVGGLLMAIIGPVFMATTSKDGYIGLTIAGFIIMFGPGLALTAIGIPCWIVTGIRNKKVK